MIVAYMLQKAFFLTLTKKIFFKLKKIQSSYFDIFKNAPMCCLQKMLIANLKIERLKNL